MHLRQCTFLHLISFPSLSPLLTFLSCLSLFIIRSSLFPPYLQCLSPDHCQPSMLCSNIHLPQSSIVDFFFFLSMSLPRVPQHLLSSNTFPFAPLLSLSLVVFRPMKALTASIRKPFVFFFFLQNNTCMCAQYQGHLFPRQPKALVFPDLFDERVTVANHVAQRGGMWVSVANDRLILLPERRAD